jgi:hypothetical protein
MNAVWSPCAGVRNPPSAGTIKDVVDSGIAMPGAVRAVKTIYIIDRDATVVFPSSKTSNEADRDEATTNFRQWVRDPS